MIKIYTKTGDDGTTSLYSGERVSKANEFIHATGTLDECNSLIGLCVSLLRRELIRQDEESLELVREQLEKIQGQIFAIGAHVATPRLSSTDAKKVRTGLSTASTLELENWIDQWQEKLPPLRHFILPGGHYVAASLHHARCECRHAERHLCPLFEKGEIDAPAIEYINRLSDYLFVTARLVNRLKGVEETEWKPNPS